MNFFSDSFGSWPSDLTNTVLAECTTLSASPNSYIDLYHHELVIKSILKPNSGDVDTDRLAREVNMTLLAGNDCALPIVGRFFSGSTIYGFITPVGQCVAQGPDDEIVPEIHQQRHSVIKQFCDLLARVHSKGIIHGDIKPANLVLDANNNLRLIDFAEAVLSSDSPSRRASTTHYISPSSIRTHAPLSYADDLYAAGVTIWHIYTGHLPFQDVEEDDLYDRIGQGLRPDLGVVDDTTVSALIGKYLQDGERQA